MFLQRNRCDTSISCLVCVVCAHSSLPKSVVMYSSPHACRPQHNWVFSFSKISEKQNNIASSREKKKKFWCLIICLSRYRIMAIIFSDKKYFSIILIWYSSLDTSNNIYLGFMFLSAFEMFTFGTTDKKIKLYLVNLH